MTFEGAISSRLLASGLAAVLAIAGVTASVAAMEPLDPELLATLELDDGFIEYDLEPGTLHLFDEENQPVGIQLIDGCAINDHYWLFGAGLSGIPLRLSVRDRNTGNETRPLLPPFAPGMPINTVFDPEALPICTDRAQAGGLPRIDAQATFTAAKGGSDALGTLTLLSDGAERSYRRLVQGDEAYRIITRGSPIAAIDESDDFDRLYLFTEGRTPRSVEGVVFSGDEGTLPVRSKLDNALDKITDARVRRAFETAKSGRVPRGIIEDLGMRKVQRVYHTALDFETLGSDAYLTIAGWIEPGAVPPEPPSLVEERFSVELMTVDGQRMPLPLVGPFEGTEESGEIWRYRSDEALVQIADQCSLSGTYWIWAGALTDKPLELVITDDISGASVTQLLWTDREEISRLSDTAALECP